MSQGVKTETYMSNFMLRGAWAACKHMEGQASHRSAYLNGHYYKIKNELCSLLLLPPHAQ